jgi:hypothetical protein
MKLRFWSIAGVLFGTILLGLYVFWRCYTQLPWVSNGALLTACLIGTTTLVQGVRAHKSGLPDPRNTVGLMQLTESLMLIMFIGMDLAAKALAAPR